MPSTRSTTGKKSGIDGCSQHRFKEMSKREFIKASSVETGKTVSDLPLHILLSEKQ